MAQVPCLGAQPCLLITSTDICNPHPFPLPLHLCTSKSVTATAGGCQPWVPCLLLERNVLHRVQTCPTGRAARQGQPWWVLPRVHPKSCFEGSRTDSSLATVVIRKSLSDSCLCTSHLKAVSDEATSCPSSTTSPRAGVHGGMRHFPVSVGGDAAAKHGWHIRHPATCTPGAMDSILPRAQSRALLLPPVPSPGV